MNRPLTVKELADACNKQIAKGNGDRVIMISNDDEGNGYHYLWYEFQTPEEITQSMINQGVPTEWGIIDELDERIASEDATIILG